MPIIFGAIVITANIEKNMQAGQNPSPPVKDTMIEDVVKQAVEKVIEILEEKKLR